MLSYLLLILSQTCTLLCYHKFIFQLCFLFFFLLLYPKFNCFCYRINLENNCFFFHKFTKKQLIRFSVYQWHFECNRFNPYNKSSTLFVGHRQTVQTPIRPAECSLYSGPPFFAYRMFYQNLKECKISPNNP